MTGILDSVYNYENRGLLAKALGYDQNFLDIIFLANKLTTDRTIGTIHRVSKIIFGFGVGLGVISNLICILGLVKIKGNLRTSFKLLLSLSISDAFRCVLDIIWMFYPYTIARIALQKYPSDSISEMILHRILTSLNILVDLASLLTTVMLAVVIYLAVKHPFSYKTLMSNHRGNLVIAFIWITCVLLVIVVNCVLEGLQVNLGFHLMQDRAVYYHVLGNMVLANWYVAWVFFIVILALNIVVYNELRKRSAKIKKIKGISRFSVVLVLITICYFVTSLPSVIMYILEFTTLRNKNFFLYFAHSAPLIVQGMKSFVNSIVYTVRLPEIRTQIARFVCCRSGTDEHLSFDRRSRRRRAVKSDPRTNQTAEEIF